LESVWSTDAPIDHIYSFSLILASTDGVGLIHAEGAPAGVTPLWKVDVPYTDRRTIALPCDLPAGEYLLLSINVRYCHRYTHSASPTIFDDD
jgi:hypothetical protein